MGLSLLQIYCGRCSANFVPLPHFNYMTPVRVCNHCFLFQVTPFTVNEWKDTLQMESECFLSSYRIMSHVQMCKLFCFWFLIFFFFFSFCWKVLLKCKQSLCVYYWFLLWSLINYQEHLMLWKWKNNQWIWTKDPCNQLIRFFFVRCNVAMVWDVIVLYCKLIVNIVSPATFCITFSCNEKGTR